MVDGYVCKFSFACKFVCFLYTFNFPSVRFAFIARAIQDFGAHASGESESSSDHRLESRNNDGWAILRDEYTYVRMRINLNKSHMCRFLVRVLRNRSYACQQADMNKA